MFPDPEQQEISSIFFMILFNALKSFFETLFFYIDFWNEQIEVFL